MRVNHPDDPVAEKYQQLVHGADLGVGLFGLFGASVGPFRIALVAFLTNLCSVIKKHFNPKIQKS